MLHFDFLTNKFGRQDPSFFSRTNIVKHGRTTPNITEQRMKLNNITKISVISCQDITRFSRLSLTTAACTFKNERPVSFKAPALLTIADKEEDGCRIYQTKLAFKTCDDWVLGLKRCSYLCETVSGIRYLIGTGDRPFPVISQAQTHPDNFADSQLTEVSVSYSAAEMPPTLIGT